MAIVLLQAVGEVVFRHEHTARVVIADVEDDVWPPVIVFRNVVDRCRTGEAMHHAKTDAVFIEHGGEHATDGTLLAPHLDARRLLVPEVAAVGPGYGARVLRGVVPGRNPLQPARFVDDPLPRDRTLLAGYPEQAVDALHLVLVHRGDEPGGEQLVTDAATSDRLRRFRRLVHCGDEVEGRLCLAPTLFETSLNLLGHGDTSRRRRLLTCFGLLTATLPARLPRTARSALACSISASSEPVGFSRARCQARSLSALIRTNARPSRISAGPMPA